MQTIPPPETFVTDAARVFCDGDEPGAVAAIATGAPTGGNAVRAPNGGNAVRAPTGAGAVRAPTGADGHPRVWLQIGAEGFADCGYCDRRFILAGGPADLR